MLGIRVIIPILALIPAFILRRKKYQLSWLQLLIIFAISIVAGTLGSKLSSTGVRQYGPVLIDTVVWFPVAIILKKQVLDIYDFGSVVAAVAMWTGKIPCLIDGCCGGIMLTETIRYPSQIVEFCMLFFILLTLIILEHKEKCKHKLWPIFMLAFGVHRYLANLMRGSEVETNAIWLGMAEAEIASLAIALISFIWIIVAYWKNRPAS